MKLRNNGPSRMTAGWSIPAKLNPNDDVTTRKETTVHRMHETDLRNFTIFNGQLFYIEHTHPSGILPEMVRDCQRCIQKKFNSKIVRFFRKGL